MLKPLLAIFFLITFLAEFSLGQSIESLRLNTKLSILNDKAFFNFPNTAKNLARSVDIMSADPNLNKETRIVYDRGKQRLVFFARELYVTSDKNLATTIRQDHDSSFSTKTLLDKDSLLSVLSTPNKFDSTKNAILVNNLYVRTQDNSVFVIEAYINQEAIKGLKEYQKLSERVFATLTKGNRRLNLKQRTEILPIFE